MSEAQRPELTLDAVVDFVWGFGSDFLLGPVRKDNTDFYWVWSDPDYNGDNTIRPFNGDPKNFTSPGFCGRCKGTHRIANYCGTEVQILSTAQQT